MVSTVRFPSSKQKKSWGALVLLVVNLGLLAWLQAAYFVLFFVVYIAFTLALNLAAPRVFSPCQVVRHKFHGMIVVEERFRRGV